MLNLMLAALLPVIPQPRAVDGSLGDEGYRIDIDKGEVIISAGTETGRLWAQRTLEQLKKDGPLPNGVIIDKPKYQVRGIVLDVGRRYIPM